MIAACLSSALSLNSCIEEVFPESSTATIDQIGKSDQAISAMVNSVVAFINAFRSYGPQFYHDFGYSGYNLIRESACEDFFCHEPKFGLSGNFWLVSFKISYLCLPLFYETRTTPSCHPSGCAYRQL